MRVSEGGTIRGGADEIADDAASIDVDTTSDIVTTERHAWDFISLSSKGKLEIKHGGTFVFDDTIIVGGINVVANADADFQTENNAIVSAKRIQGNVAYELSRTDTNRSALITVQNAINKNTVVCEGVTLKMPENKTLLIDAELKLKAASIFEIAGTATLSENGKLILETSRTGTGAKLAVNGASSFLKAASATISGVWLAYGTSGALTITASGQTAVIKGEKQNSLRAVEAGARITQNGGEGNGLVLTADTTVDLQSSGVLVLKGDAAFPAMLRLESVFSKLTTGRTTLAQGVITDSTRSAGANAVAYIAGLSGNASAGASAEGKLSSISASSSGQYVRAGIRDVSLNSETAVVVR
jgi:hypothetical protein